MSYLQEGLRLLQKNGYKCTQPRKRVLSVLELAEKALSPYEIVDRVYPDAAMNVVTVYRILEVLCSLQIAHKISTKGGYVRCDFEDQKGCHHFLVCAECDQVQEFVTVECSHQQSIAQKFDFKTKNHVFEVEGVCKSCQV